MNNCAINKKRPVQKNTISPYFVMNFPIQDYKWKIKECNLYVKYVKRWNYFEQVEEKTYTSWLTSAHYITPKNMLAFLIFPLHLHLIICNVYICVHIVRTFDFILDKMSLPWKWLVVWKSWKICFEYFARLGDVSDLNQMWDWQV